MLRSLGLLTLGVVVVPLASAADVRVPGDLLDFASWRLTLPVDTPHAGVPDEITSDELRTFVDPRFFTVDAAGTAVVFRAPCGGVTTKGSRYPRSELRELTADGRRAAWSTDDDGLHELSVTAAIRRLPPRKPHVVCCQIHDADDDLLMVRLENRRLFVESSELGETTLDDDYEPGRWFDVRIVAGHGRVVVWHDGVAKVDRKVSRDGCYFKFGCYTQSNVAKGDAADAVAEVAFRRAACRWRSGAHAGDDEASGNEASRFGAAD